MPAKRRQASIPSSGLLGDPVVDHFAPWSRYPLDLGHNYVLADVRCNGDKADRLPATEHLGRWCARNAQPDWTAALEESLIRQDVTATRRVALWAYAWAERARATVWEGRRDIMIRLDPRWRNLLLTAGA